MTPETPPTTPVWITRALAAFPTAAAAIVWTHAFAGITRHLGPADAPLAARSLTVAALAAVVLALVPRWPRIPVASGFACAAVCALPIAVLFPDAWAGALALLLAVPAAVAGGALLARHIPAEVVHGARRRRGLAILWTLLAVMAVAQIGRLASWITDPEVDWFLTTRDAFWADHECLPAYLHGAELAARGENPYDPVHYPALHRDATPTTEVVGMSVEDPFQYPPVFLLLPKLALSLTDDYTTIRTVWFGLNTTLVLGMAGCLAFWIGGPVGRSVALLIPAFAAAFPTLHNLQYGQFHLATIALAVGGVIALESRRRSLGGALLGIAILAKLFPGILLVPLALRRRFREIAWTGAWAAAFTLIALGILGPAPFMDFALDHLPRLGNGSAFAFEEAWPEIRELVIADLQGPYGLVRKLAFLGVPGLSDAIAAPVGKIFGLFVLLAAALSTKTMRSRHRDVRAGAVLSLLGLASMASPGAFGDYVPATACWLATIVVLRELRRPGGRTLIVLTIVFQSMLLGTTPLGAWFHPTTMMVLSSLGVLALGALFVRSSLGTAPAAVETSSNIDEPFEPVSELSAA